VGTASPTRRLLALGDKVCAAIDGISVPSLTSVLATT
jgi:hypothetical protein